MIKKTVFTLLLLPTFLSAFEVTSYNLDRFMDGFQHNSCRDLPSDDLLFSQYANSENIQIFYGKILDLSLSCAAPDRNYYFALTEKLFNLAHNIRTKSIPSYYADDAFSLTTILAEETLASLTFRFGDQYYKKVTNVPLSNGSRRDILHGVQIQEGDVFISKGPSLTSSFLAKVLGQGENFSHSTIAHVDDRLPAGRKILLPEALIDDSSVKLRTLDHYYLPFGMTKLYVLRYADNKDVRNNDLHKQMAEGALGGFINLMAARTDNDPITKPSFSYDFYMDPNNSNALFCTEVPYLAFAMNGVFDNHNPYSSAYWTKRDPRQKTLLDFMNVRAEFTPAPSDIFKNRSYQVVAEMYQLQRLLTDRRDTAFIETFLVLINRSYPQVKAYTDFVNSLGTSSAVSAIERLALLGLITEEQKKVLLQKVPTGIDVKQLAIFLPLDKFLAPKVRAKMYQKEAAFIAVNNNLPGAITMRKISYDVLSEVLSEFNALLKAKLGEIK